MKKIGIIGAGAWGTALAGTVGRGDNDVLIWSRSPKAADSINKNHENEVYLPGLKLSERVVATVDLADLKDRDAILLAVPAQNLRDMCGKIKSVSLATDIPLILCCKGIEKDSFKLTSEVIAEILENPVAILSGPNFADEIAGGLPAGTTLACADKKLGMELVETIGSKLFRAYYSDDIIGAQIGGAVKNVIAIACGIAIGKGLGENARAALVTRGLAEIGRLCLAKGGKYETLMGLSGIGDIMLTCGSLKSRNMSLGYKMGQGKVLQDVIAGQSGVTEGVATAQSVCKLAENLGVEMPICSTVYSVLHEGRSVDEAIKSLLERPFKSEISV